MTNHDLVLSDFRLGGGLILSAPEDSFYIFDEGHQLAEKCLQHFACFARSGRTLNNLAESQQWFESKHTFFVENDVRPESLAAITANQSDLLQLTRDTFGLCWSLLVIKSSVDLHSTFTTRPYAMSLSFYAPSAQGRGDFLNLYCRKQVLALVEA